MSLDQQLALVTGAGHGLGKAIALRLARAGASLILTDRDAQRVNDTVAELRAAKIPASGYVLDVSSAEQVAALHDRVRAEIGPISILVNNAGVVFGGEFLGVPIDRHLATVAVNLNGVLAVTHAFLPDLIARPRGFLVNIASAAAIVPLPCAASYAASKAAVLAFSESLREELRLQGTRHVHVSTICPSYISTGLFEGARPARLTWMLTPDEVAEAVLEAILRKRKTVLLPWTVNVLHTVASILPTPIYRAICRALGVSTSMQQWRGHS